MTNPLEQNNRLPAFHAIKPEHAIPALERGLAANRALLAEKLEQGDFDFESLMVPLMAANERLNRAWSPVRHLNSVMNSEALRVEHDKGLPLMSEYWTDLGQNSALYEAVKAIRDSEQFEQLDPAARRIVDDELRDFRLAGVALADEQKARYKAINQKLSELSS
ncbi:MAG: oligopeptidase A, partial [Gammaproteobacteria bacterium]